VILLLDPDYVFLAPLLLKEPVRWGHRLGELDERRAEAGSELDALRGTGRRLDELRAYSDLVDERLRELPFLVHGREQIIRDHACTDEHEERKREAREGGVPPIFPSSPEMFRERILQEKEGLRLAEERERAERYRGVYTSLGLTVVAHKDGAMELT